MTRRGEQGPRHRRETAGLKTRHYKEKKGTMYRAPTTRGERVKRGEEEKDGIALAGGLDIHL